MVFNISFCKITKPIVQILYKYFFFLRMTYASYRSINLECTHIYWEQLHCFQFDLLNTKYNSPKLLLYLYSCSLIQILWNKCDFNRRFLKIITFFPTMICTSVYTPKRNQLKMKLLLLSRDCVSLADLWQPCGQPSLWELLIYYFIGVTQGSILGPVLFT